MECKKCKSKWETQLSASKTMTSCPFCGASLTDKESMNKEGPFDTSKEALIYIAKKHGVETLLGNLKDLFPDYAPLVSKQKKGLVLAVYQHGSAKILQDNVSSKQADKEIAFKKAVEKLTEAFIAEQAATTIILEFTEALGWNITPATQEKAPIPNSSVIEVHSQPVINQKTTQVSPNRENWLLELQEMQVSLPGGEKMAFVKVPAGEFLMGTSTDDFPYAFSHEKPQHKVYLDEYWIGKYPVTNAQYRLYDPEHHFSPGKEDHPVMQVTWHDAQKYCIWMTRVTGQKITLPTEAQWEKAARGTDGRRYPWGNRAPSKRLANFDNAIGDTTPVDRYPDGASPYGVLDMAGNVNEWCADWFDGRDYKHSPIINPTGPSIGKGKVLRGGNWKGEESDIRTYRRKYCFPYESMEWYHIYGFRCLLPPFS